MAVVSSAAPSPFAPTSFTETKPPAPVEAGWPSCAKSSGEPMRQHSSARGRLDLYNPNFIITYHTVTFHFSASNVRGDDIDPLCCTLLRTARQRSLSSFQGLRTGRL